MVRSAILEEAEAIASAYEWLFAPPGTRPPEWDPERAAAALRRAILSDRAEVLVAEEDEALVGLCTVYLDLESVRFGQRAFVEDLAVHPDHRSAGHGRELLDAARAWARAHEATHLELDSADTRTDAHRFYEREAPAYRSRSFGWTL